MDISVTIEALPPPAQTVDEGLEHIRSHGLCIIHDVLTGNTLKSAQEALYRAAEDERARGRGGQWRYDFDATNQRLWNMLSRDPIFVDMAEHPMALDFVKAVIGWPALLGNISANITGPGGGEMVLHADQGLFPEPWAADPQGLNVGWCIDDFTDENGATRVVPGSHQLNRSPRPDEAMAPSVAMEAPAGSIIVFESRLWHKTGFNKTSDRHRAGVFAWYSKPIYRPQENWFLSLNPSVRRFGSEELLTLLGYKTELMGLIYGDSPN